MIKVINFVGKLVVRAFFREARKLNAKANAKAAEARKLAERAKQLSAESVTHINESAHNASQAVKLSTMFK